MRRRRRRECKKKIELKRNIVSFLHKFKKKIKLRALASSRRSRSRRARSCRRPRSGPRRATRSPPSPRSARTPARAPVPVLEFFGNFIFKIQKNEKRTCRASSEPVISSEITFNLRVVFFFSFFFFFQNGARRARVRARGVLSQYLRRVFFLHTTFLLAAHHHPEKRNAFQLAALIFFLFSLFYVPTLRVSSRPTTTKKDTRVLRGPRVPRPLRERHARARGLAAHVEHRHERASAR